MSGSRLQLTRLGDDLAAATRRADALAEATFAIRPAPERWSPAECVQHLTLTTAALLPSLDAALAQAPAGFPATRPYRRGLLGAALAWSLEPGRGRYPTTAAFVPVATGTRDQVLAAFRESQEALAVRLGRAAGLNLTRIRVRSPFNARLRYNGYAALCIVVVHQRRHLAQAEVAGRAAGAQVTAPADTSASPPARPRRR